MIGITRTLEKVMANRSWFTIPELQKIIRMRLKKHAMETTISARIRDLRKEEYGGYNIDRRIREGTKLYEYRMTK